MDIDKIDIYYEFYITITSRIHQEEQNERKANSVDRNIIYGFNKEI